MKRVIKIQGLDCPVCAEALQAAIQKIKGVNFVSVDYVSQMITVEIEEENVLTHVIKKANNFEEVRVLDGSMSAMKEESRAKEWIVIAISAILFLAGLLVHNIWDNKAAVIIGYVAFLSAYFLVGYPVLQSTVKNVAKGRIFDENFLMTVASIGAFCIGEVSEAVLVMLLYQIGELLQSIAVGTSRRSVVALMQLKSECAVVLHEGEQKEVEPEGIQVGDILLIKAGERVPVDGILLSENASMDTKSITGEAEIRAIQQGEEVLSGCINAGNAIEVRAIRPYSDSAVGKILEMVENAAAGKAQPEKFITKFAKIYTPVVCCLALVIAVVAPLLSGLIVENTLYFRDFTRWVQASLTFLVISCPCALIISVPLSYFSGIGACAHKGILVKGATYLDVLAKVKTIAFDKTGTLTKGDFSVKKIYNMGDWSEQELLSLVAAAERESAHPIAKAFAVYEINPLLEQVTEVPGGGLLAKLGEDYIAIGNEKLLTQNGVEVAPIDSVDTVIYVAKNNRLLGAIEIGDTLRQEAKQTISSLQKLNISKLVMLTGDRESRARKIANEVGMYEVKSELLPMDKLKCAEELRQNGALVYVGDGINDAPVMTAADCAVSMGKLGSAAAVEVSDLVLISDNLKAIPNAVRIAKKTRAIVMQNIVFSIVMKLVFMSIGFMGILPLGLAVFADVGVMLLAVLNSFRIRLAMK